MANEAIVLVGGLGTRLKGTVADVPKPLAQINGRPFLSYLLSDLSRQKIDQVILATGYGSDKIYEFCKSNKFQFDIKFSDEKSPLGTGGAIRRAMLGCQAENVFVLNGDTYFPVNLGQLQNVHLDGNFDATIAIKRVNDGSRYGSVVLKNNTVTQFLEKNLISAPATINGGVLMLQRTRFLSNTEDKAFSLEHDYLPKVLIQNSVGGVEFQEPFIDIGVPEDYFRAQNLIPIWTHSE